MSKIVIVGGSGKIAKLFSRLATSKTGAQITSLVRSRDHFDAISETGATPQLLDIESAKVEELQQAFEGAQSPLCGGRGRQGSEGTHSQSRRGGSHQGKFGTIRKVAAQTCGQKTKSGT